MARGAPVSGNSNNTGERRTNMRGKDGARLDELIGDVLVCMEEN